MTNYERAAAIRSEMIAHTATEEARAEYRAIRKAYAAHREALTECHYNASKPAETVAALVARIGHDNAAEIVAIMVRAKGEHDERIGARVRAWASALVTINADEIRDTLGLYYCDSIHPAHLDQIARAMMEYTPAETAEAPETTESTADTESPAESEKTAAEPAAVLVADLLEDLDTGNYGDRLNDYRDSSGYICDTIAEIADSATSIYYSDILDFVREHPDSLADVISEGLYDPSHEYDFYKHAQAAEYMLIESDLREHLADSLMVAALNFIRYDIGREDIPAALAELLREWCDDADEGDRMDEITDNVREWLEEYDTDSFDTFCALHHCVSCPYRNCKSTEECRACFAKDTGR